MNWTIGQVADALGASFAGSNGRTAGFSIDSRSLQHGEVFFAVRAARDGHEFVLGAFEKGASAAVVDWDWTIPVALAGKALLRVKDTRHSLGQLANAQRRAWNGPVLAVTGSSGKTTVKEAAAAMLATQLRTAKTAGNLNNDLGVPLTLLGVSEDAEVAVIEMGMNHAGEIRHLAAIAEPNVGLVTNVSHAHVGAFDSIDGVAKAKCELIESLGPRGTAVLNADDPNVRGFDQFHNGPVMTFSVRETADFEAADVSERPGGGSRFGLKREGKDTRLRFETHLPGVHNVSNLLGAMTAASALGVEPEGLADVIDALRPGMHRGETRTFGALTVIDDCYNANPSAIEAALQDLAGRTAQRRVAVLGEMRELGAMSEQLHRRVGQAVAAAGIDLLVAVEGDARWIAEAAITAGMSADQVEVVGGATAAGAALPELLRAGDVVLVKGSRGVGLERTVDAVAEAFGSLVQEVK